MICPASAETRATRCLGCLFLGLLVLLWPLAGAQAALTGPMKATPVASGLNGPDGMAWHPETKDLYVAERKGGRISVIRNGSRTTVIESGGFTVSSNIPPWGIAKSHSREFLQEGVLRNPGSLGFMPDGTLYVAERTAYGRLLKFTPDESGNYPVAEVVPIPWIDKPFAWDDLKITPDGRIFLIGYDQKGEAGLHFGSVLMRATDGDWWVVDYGPFSSFSALYLARNNDILVTCERTKGEIVGWDIERHIPISTVAESVFQAEAESFALLTDGSYVVGEVPMPDKQSGSRGQSRVMHVDPETGQATPLAEGFDLIGSIILKPETGSLLVSDAGAGTITEVQPNASVLTEGYLLQRSLEAFESSQGFSPRVAPAFLKNFLSRIGGADSGERPQGGATEQAEGQPQKDALFSSSFTLREFATKIPLVAGKVRTLLDKSNKDENPVVEIEFLLFFPSHVVKSSDMATPSLSFFTATRKDGTMEKSRLLMGNLNASQRVGDKWLLQTDSASIYVPIATCGMEKTDDGMDLNLAFLGMGIYDDFYLRLTTGKVNSGRLMVEGRYGGSADYKLSFVDKPTMGSEPVKNLVVAGFDPAVKGEELGWLNIGRLPVSSAIALGEQEVARFSGMDQSISDEIEKKELERRIDTGTGAQEVDAEGQVLQPPAEEEDTTAAPGAAEKAGDAPESATTPPAAELATPEEAP